MRSIGMDVHRSFAQVAILEDGKTTEVRIDLDHDAVVAFGQTLRPDDEVVLDVNRLATLPPDRRPILTPTLAAGQGLSRRN